MTFARTVLLGDVCKQDRTTVKTGEMSDLRYIGLESIEANTGRFNEGELSKTPEAPQANSFRFGAEHVLYGKLRPYLNKVALADFEGKCSTEIIPLLPSAELDRRYLGYFLRSPMTVSRISEKTAGARMPRADMDFIFGLEINLLSLGEQLRAVDILSRAEGILRLRHDAEKKAAELIPALFLDMFGDTATNPKGWPVTTLGEVVEEFRYGTSQKSGPTGLPVLRIPNVVGDRLEPAAMKFVAVPETETNRLRLQNGDMLFVRTNGNPDYVGRSAVFEPEIMRRAGFDGDNVLYASYLIRARIRRELLEPSFLQKYLSSAEGRKNLKERSRTSAGQFNINTDGLASIPVPVPTFSMQSEFVSRCRDVFSIQSQQSVATAKAQATFDSLLSQVFSL
jgi:type I restriction enzyme S subunit